MKVFSKAIVVKKKEDGTFTVSVALTDKTVVVQSLSRKDALTLKVELEKLLDG